MPDDASNEVIVIVPEDPGNPALNPADGSAPADSEPVIIEVFDAILDPAGTGDPTDLGATEPEIVVLEPGADSSAIETGAVADSADVTDPGSVADPIGVAPDTGDTTSGPGIADPTDATATGSDPDTTPADPDTTTGTTDPDAQAQSDTLADAQQSQQQAEQAESQAVASGDYSAANDDAQQAYSASQDVANAGGPDNTDKTWEAQLNESWANWDQQTANEDAASAQSYADAGFTDDAQMYAADAAGAEATADSSAEAGEYGDPLGPEADSSAAAEAPAEEAPVEDAAAADTSVVDEDSSAAGD